MCSAQTKGVQQLSFFNGHYEAWCYPPTAGFIQFDDEPEHLYGECRYAAGSWNRERRVVFKAEVGRLGVESPGGQVRLHLQVPSPRLARVQPSSGVPR